MAPERQAGRGHSHATGPGIIILHEVPPQGHVQGGTRQPGVSPDARRDLGPYSRWETRPRRERPLEAVHVCTWFWGRDRSPTDECCPPAPGAPSLPLLHPGPSPVYNGCSPRACGVNAARGQLGQGRGRQSVPEPGSVQAGARLLSQSHGDGSLWTGRSRAEEQGPSASELQPAPAQTWAWPPPQTPQHFLWSSTGPVGPLQGGQHPVLYSSLSWAHPLWPRGPLCQVLGSPEDLDPGLSIAVAHPA